VLRELDETGSLLVEERQRLSKADGLHNLLMVLGRLSRSLKWLMFHNLRPRNVLASSDIAISRASFVWMRRSSTEEKLREEEPTERQIRASTAPRNILFSTSEEDACVKDPS
jgi:hypothetical protein